MNRSLYEINEEYLHLFDEVDEETGEIKFDEKRLEELNEEFETKADNIACLIKDKKALLDARKNEITNLQEKNKKEEKQIDYLNKYLVNALKLREKKKIETARNTISTRNSKVVDILDEKLIPTLYTKEEVKTKVDKKSIKEAIAKGIEVPGALLKENVSLIIK